MIEEARTSAKPVADIAIDRWPVATSAARRIRCPVQVAPAAVAHTMAAGHLHNDVAMARVTMAEAATGSSADGSHAVPTITPAAAAGVHHA